MPKPTLETVRIVTIPEVTVHGAPYPLKITQDGDRADRVRVEIVGSDVVFTVEALALSDAWQLYITGKLPGPPEQPAEPAEPTEPTAT